MIAINGFVLHRSAGLVRDSAMNCRTTREKDVLSQEDFVLLHRDVHLCLDVTLILAQSRYSSKLLLPGSAVMNDLENMPLSIHRVGG